MCGDIRLTSGSGPSQYGPKTAPRREVVRKVHLGTSINTTRRALHRGQHPGESLFGNWLYIRSYILGLRSGFDCDCFHLYFRRWLRRALLSLGVSIIRLYGAKTPKTVFHWSIDRWTQRQWCRAGRERTAASRNHGPVRAPRMSSRPAWRKIVYSRSLPLAPVATAFERERARCKSKRTALVMLLFLFWRLLHFEALSPWYACSPHADAQIWTVRSIIGTDHSDSAQLAQHYLSFDKVIEEVRRA